MKKLMVWLLACVMLTGCSLAQDGESEQGMMPADQLVGILIQGWTSIDLEGSK